ncbi:hypothetical protein [Elizabethkingia miricola]|uniref:hypothetical protein n=1 Tax=Elizabethkingia miricola TaxID=172045 RepID=UPI00099AD116|nr:hypothetical protein [Elizabethkingia miricola]OPC36158.1 hypothetical protein BAX99_19035 [Elizabethkingia miricola]
MENRRPDNIMIIGSGDLEKFCQVNNLNYEEMRQAIELFGVRSGAKEENINLITAAAKQIDNEMQYVKEKPRGVIPPGFYRKIRK